MSDRESERESTVFKLSLVLTTPLHYSIAISVNYQAHAVEFIYCRKFSQNLSKSTAGFIDICDLIAVYWVILSLNTDVWTLGAVAHRVSPAATGGLAFVEALEHLQVNNAELVNNQLFVQHIHTQLIGFV